MERILVHREHRLVLFVRVLPGVEIYRDSVGGSREHRIRCRLDFAVPLLDDGLGSGTRVLFNALVGFVLFGRPGLCRVVRRDIRGGFSGFFLRRLRGFLRRLDARLGRRLDWRFGRLGIFGTGFGRGAIVGHGVQVAFSAAAAVVDPPEKRSAGLGTGPRRQPLR